MNEYIEFEGRQYVLVSKAERELRMMADDTINVIADFLQKFRPNDPELVSAVRILVSTSIDDPVT